MVIRLRRMRRADHVARIGEMINAYTFLVEKLGRPFGRPRRKWKDNTRMGLEETGWEGVDWTHLAQDRGQWRALVNLWDSIKGGEFLDKLSECKLLMNDLFHGVS
jgi:hypothetical protein